jgi:arginine N-succinyltransferase
MLMLRPCRAGDLARIEEIAGKSAIGITSLPTDRERLAEKIRASEQSFARETTIGDETYFLVLEDTQSDQIVGTSGMVASAGIHDRFYSYRKEIIVHASQELNVSNRVQSLHLCHDLTGYSLLTSFFILPELRATQWPQLLSRARLLFMAEHAKRFADKLAAENAGLCDATGRSPFWDAVGRRFFDMDYPRAERLSGGRSKTFIAELMPQYPIYVPLLSAEAQAAIGKLHPVAELPFSILRDEGFETDTYVDIFDGGPTVEARVQTLRTMRDNRRLQLSATPLVDARATRDYLVATTDANNFRAMVVNTTTDKKKIFLPREVIDALGVEAGHMLRAVPVTSAGGLTS